VNNYDILKGLIALELNCQIADITDDSGWKKSLNWDSLAHIGIITAVENHFSISIEDSEIENMKDFNSILQFINNKTTIMNEVKMEYSKEKSLTFKSLDGIELHGKLTQPTNQNIKGGLLLLHGCPAYMDEYGFYSSQPNEFMTHGGMAEFLSANGYVTLRFNYRSQSKDMTPEKMGDLSISGMIADTESAFLILRDFLKAELPIYVVATSFSGGIAIQWINNFERNIKHLFLMCPLLDMRHTLRRTQAVVNVGEFEVLSPDIALGLQKNGYVFSGDRKMNYAFFDELLTMNIKREFSLLKCPNSIFHGTIDPSVRYEDSKVFVEKYSNGLSALYTYENARHGFGGPKDADGHSDITIKYRNHQDIFNKMVKIME